jgi:hypothetical protein
MVNWLRHKFYILLLLPVILSGTVEQNNLNRTWGFYGHKRINRMAVFTLPPPVFGFYKEHIEYLTEHAVDPDKRRYAVDGEAQRHYIDLDHYTAGVVDSISRVPHGWNDAITKFSEDTLQAYGILPWHIQVMKYRLQQAFESQNVDLILKYSADIGHYIGDAHVPLHTTKNYNGQLTGQKGIHGLWESRLVEMNAPNYDYFVGKSVYIPHLLSYTWNIINTSHRAVDSVLLIEKELTNTFAPDKKYSYESRGSNTVKVYSKAYSDAYHNQLNGMVERRMRESIRAIGSIWYTAWVDAGQPDLTLLQNKQPSKELLNEHKSLEDINESNQAKGRICH